MCCRFQFQVFCCRYRSPIGRCDVIICYQQKYEKGIPVTQVEIIGDTNETGTKVTFYPDKNIFPIIDFDPSLIELRLKELAYLNKGLKIIFIDGEKEKEFYFEKGIISFVENINKTKVKLHYLTDTKTAAEVAENQGFLKKDQVDVILTWVDNPQNWAKKMGYE